MHFPEFLATKIPVRANSIVNLGSHPMERAYGTDEVLMRRVASGDREALSVLLRRHATPLLTFLQRMNGDHHRSEELFQETFLAIWVGRTKYEFPRPFRPWLFGVAANKCRAEHRLQSSKPAFSQNHDGEVGPAREPAAIDAVIAAETAGLVQAAVLKLPTKQREVVALRIWNGLSYADIACALDCGESTVRSNMFHGLEAIRKHLDPQLR
jgi:RNA polymerase sigma-70 factor (ECF subfamily)